MNTQQKKECNRYLRMGCLTLFLSLCPFVIDGLMQWAGVQAKADTLLWKIIWIGICSIFNAALFFSSTIRQALGVKRLVWAMGAIPVIFIVSMATTMMSQSAFIKQQANVVSEAREARSTRLMLAKSMAANAEQQSRINHVTNAGYSLQLAMTQLDKAESSKRSTGVTNEESAEIPLAVINALLPSPMSVNTYLVLYYTLISFGLLLIGYFFGEAATVCFERAERIATWPRQSQTNTDTVRQLSDSHVRSAIADRLTSEPNTDASVVNRAWIAEACKMKYQKSRAGHTLDKFIKPTRKSIGRWYKRLKTA